MSPDKALDLLVGMVQVALIICGPILGGSLVAGVSMGIFQTATQINEASISYIVKIGAILAILLVAGPAIGEKALTYTKHSFEAISHVVD